MAKLKTHKGATKRFKLTGKKKVARTHQMSKNNSHKRNKRNKSRSIDQSVKVIAASKISKKIKTNLNNN